MRKASNELKAAQDQAVERRRLLETGRVRLAPERSQPEPPEQGSQREAVRQPDDAE